MKLRRLVQGQRKQKQREESLIGNFSLERAVEEALEDLRDHRRLISEMPPISITNDAQFEMANPQHPEAASNRFSRIDAAEYLYRLVRLLNGHTLGEIDDIKDFFRNVGRDKANAIENWVVDHLHEALFDRDAAVRLAVVETLALLARSASTPFLERLAQQEDEGDLIRQAIPKALDCCRNAKASDIRNWLSDVLGTLNADVADSWLALRHRDSDVNRRNFVRAVFAAIEGSLSVLKTQVLEEWYAGRYTPSRGEAALLRDEAYDVTESGKPRAKPSFLPIQRNIRFTLAVFARAHGISLQPNCSGRGWQALRQAVETRNRITHPKASTDLSISRGEVELTTEAYTWFLDTMFAVHPQGHAEIRALLDTAGWVRAI